MSVRNGGKKHSFLGHRVKLLHIFLSLEIFKVLHILYGAYGLIRNTLLQRSWKLNCDG